MSVALEKKNVSWTFKLHKYIVADYTDEKFCGHDGLFAVTSQVFQCHLIPTSPFSDKLFTSTHFFWGFTLWGFILFLHLEHIPLSPFSI